MAKGKKTKKRKEIKKTKKKRKGKFKVLSQGLRISIGSIIFFPLRRAISSCRLLPSLFLKIIGLVFSSVNVEQVLSLERNHKNENQHMQSPTQFLQRESEWKKEGKTNYTLL